VPAAARPGHRPDRVAIQRRFTFEVRQPIQWRRIQPRAWLPAARFVHFFRGQDDG
jgi:hypothetical protein